MESQDDIILGVLPVMEPETYWIDIDTLSRIKGVTTRAIRLAIAKGKYEAREVSSKGGKSYEILLSSIEPELQEKYLNHHIKEAVINNKLVSVRKKNEKFTPEPAKQTALARLDLLKAWHKFREDQENKRDGDRIFLDLYNFGEYMPEIFKIIGTVSIGTLHRWNKILKDQENNWEALLPAYRYTSHHEYRTTLTNEEIEIFLKFLLHPNQFSIGKAISLSKHILQKQGVEDLPEDITFRRYANWFKKHNYDKWIMAREGEKALKDKVEPYIIRDPSVLDVGEVLVADGHKLNFQVINPFTGRPSRATLVGFLDWKSSALVGYEIMLEENTQCIASALRNSILNLGIIPKICYIDNGKAFRAKYFTNTNFEESGFNGIYSKLGIKPVFARPYNARAKVIERFFKEFQESFEKLLPSYIGSSIESKPAYLKRNEKLHKEIHPEYVPTIQEAIKLIECWLMYKHSQPCPNVQGKTIAQVLNERKQQVIESFKLDDLMLSSEIKTIYRNGIRFLNSYYYNEILYGFKDKVVIKYSLFDLTQVKLYTLKGEYLGVAERVTATHPMANHMGGVKDMEDFKQKIQKQKKLRRKTINSVKPYLTNEDLKFLEHQMEEAEPPYTIENVTPVIEIPALRVEVNLNDKPIFNTAYERYEWLVQQSCPTEEERTWMMKYKNSEEYKLIYEESL